jgi:hypothetical protein
MPRNKSALTWFVVTGCVLVLLGSSTKPGWASELVIASVDLRDYQESPSFKFISAAPAFSVSYPAAWGLAEFDSPMVYYVQARDRLPAMRVLVLEERWWLPLRFATRAAMSQLAALGRDIELVSESVEDWNGLRVNVGEVHWTMNIGLGLPLRTLFVSAYSDGKWIMLNMITGPAKTPGTGVFPAELRAIARTLHIGELK